jgi:hypothetical protein
MFYCSLTLVAARHELHYNGAATKRDYTGGCLAKVWYVLNEQTK